MKVSKLGGALLDYWVARAEGIEPSRLILRDQPDAVGKMCVRDDLFKFNPSESWLLGGPVIGRQKIAIYWDVDEWVALWHSESSASGTLHARGPVMAGETALVAAMRCYVASKFGEEVPA
ncbi:phage protein NinX family protein [Burkholderia vietnamiensis]|uniref:phage protein NinX family protein n=1 Tax=Burkholderia vietnamiensis TaxID=60552 RepID=UPI001CF36680|nr:phage protein NinX family protein [Burkholderia vietnamiensis]MCA7985176.1 DUF2591 domain-containing protein [Burkholderia vietnamiensis]